MERLTYTVSEVAQLLGISRSKAYELVAEGLIPVVPLPGRRKLVARAVLRRLLDVDAASRDAPTTDHELSDNSTGAPSTTDPPPDQPQPVAPRPNPGPPLHTVAPGVRGRLRGAYSDEAAG